MFLYTFSKREENRLVRPSKPLEERLVTLSVRVPQKSLVLLDRILEGEIQYLRTRRLPTRGVNRSAAFRTIWELGELEYVLQRATLWVTRRVNRYTLEQSAEQLGWDTEALRRMLQERGIIVPPTPNPGPLEGPNPESP